MEVRITDIFSTPIKGVTVADCGQSAVYRENWFEWTAYPVVSKLHTNEVVSGLLQGWHHTPEFDVVEYHADHEQFWFFEGTALMLFCDIVNGSPDPATAQIVRVPAGTQLDIEPGKAHFVAVAETDTFKALVVSPKQDAPRLPLPERVSGR